MRIELMNKLLGLAGLAAAALLGSTAAHATTVSLTAQPASLTLPDGGIVPMWAYCGGLDSTASNAGVTSGGSCVAAAAGVPAWTQGPTIVVPAGDSLTINLSNTLPVPTSLTIIGQLGGGLGTPNYASSPAHTGVSVTTFPGNGDGKFTPPAQPDRARSFVPEANGIGLGAASAGTQSYSWTGLKPGTYLYQSGSRPSLQVPMGLYGVLVVTTPAAGAPALGSPGSAYSATAAAASYPLAYDADALFLFSEVDPVQNAAVDAAAKAMALSAAPVSGAASGAAAAAFAALEQRVNTTPGAATPIVRNPSAVPNDPALPGCDVVACYPPAVNYAPTYFLVNGQSYDRANPAASAAIVPDTPAGVTPSGRVLARLVNAGLKTHIPTFVGLKSLLVAEDGNLQPDVALGLLKSTGSSVGGKLQSAVLLPAGKTMDVVLTPPMTAGTTSYVDTAYPLFDRELSLTAGNKGAGGMQAFLAIAKPGTTQATLAAALAAAGSSALPSAVTASATDDTFYLPAGTTTYRGNVLLNDIGVTGVTLSGSPITGLTLNADGSFTYAPGAAIADGFHFAYTGNLGAAGATVTFKVSASAGDTITVAAQSFTSQVATLIRVPHPGVLASASSLSGFTLVASGNPAAPGTQPASGETFVNTQPGCTGPGACKVKLYPDGAFIMSASVPGDYTFDWYAVNPQGQSASNTVTVTFPAGSGANVVVKDAVSGRATSAGYRWVLEEDQTFLHDPGNAGFVPASVLTPVSLSYTPVTLAGSGPSALVSPQVTATVGTLPANFPGFVAGSYVQIAGSTTDAFNGTYRINAVNGNSFSYTLWQNPAAGTSTAAASATATNAQSLATNFHRSYMPVVAVGCTGSKVCNDLAQPVAPGDVLLDPTKRYFLSVLPDDAGDPAAGVGDTGHTMGAANIAGNQISAPGANPVTVLVPLNPLPPAQLSAYVFEDSNPVSGDVDEGEPGLGGFQIEVFDVRGSSGDGVGQITYDVFNQPLTNALANTPGTGTDGLRYPNLCPTTPNGVAQPVGVVYTCMPVMVNGSDVSPFTGMALIRNMEPGRLDVQAHPAAWREGRGEKWIQVSTLEGTPNNDTFLHPGEPAYWQEFGPPGFHSFIGFLNPDHVAKVNADNVTAAQAAGQTLANVSGRITNLHMDRPPEGKLNNSCQPGNADAACARAALNYTTCYVGINAQSGDGATVAFAQCDADGRYTLKNVPAGNYALFIWDEWLDQIKAKQAVTVPASTASVSVPDIPVFNWFTRLQETIYLDLNGNGLRDEGEPGLSNLPLNVRFRDGSFSNRIATDANGDGFFNEVFPLFNWYVIESDQTRYKNTGVHVIYDAGGVPDQTPLANPRATNNHLYFNTAGVLNSSEKFPVPSANRVPGAVYFDGSTERIDPGAYVFEGFQGFINQTEFVEFGKQPYGKGENGGIAGMIYYASVRAFDDPRLKVQNLWEPGIPRVRINLYQRTTNPDGSTSDRLVDTTLSNSWDDWANGTGAFGAGVPNLSCPGNPPAVPAGQLPGYTAGVNDPFVNFTLGADPAGGATNQFKCYDGQHAFNQVQPAVYDGFYAFPTASCQACTTAAWKNPDGSDAPTPILDPGTYVVEVVAPDGFEITKEEDKNILIGDTWIAAAPQQFGSPVNIFILPDQATLNDQNPEGFPLVNPPCVGTPHVVPDFLSLVPEAAQVAPYAGQTRNLCDRKLVVQQDQMAMTADFQLWTPTPIAGHVSGLMLNDAAAEFDPYSPSFGEKFALPNAPVSVRDYNGTEILRAYTDKWGTFDFLNVSTWDANVPNPSGYAPNMLTYCMNDPGPVPAAAAGKYQVDPYYNPQYSDFCYNWPILPGITTYLDTPVLPVSAFASHYAPVDCQYAEATPAIKRVDGNWIPTAARAFPATATLPTSGTGPFIDLGASGSKRLTITALGDTSVLNPAYAGPNAAPNTSYAANRITRHYGFGSAAGSVQLVSASGTATTLTVAAADWKDGSIVATLPASLGSGDYQLVVTNAGGVSTIDAVTVTLANLSTTGVRAPWYVAAPPPGTGIGAGQGFGLPHPIQDAIDSTSVRPGDLVIVDEGLYPELVVLWKPIKLQGVGAAAVTIQATKYPNSKVADWRNRINLLFGLDPEGNQLVDAQGNPRPAQIDPLVGQEITGGIVRLEPSALSTEEGAGITVLAANVNGGSCALGTSAPTPFRNLVPVTPFGFYPTLAPMGVAGTPPSSATPGTGAPRTPRAVASANSGTLPAGSYWYVVTALNAAGESVGSAEVTATVVAGSSVTVSWTAPTGVTGITGYQVYRGTAKGAENLYFGAGTALSWTDGVINEPVIASTQQRNWSNFNCATAPRIDGIGVTGSDAGGGIYVNGWAHGLQISNNRVFGNSGPYSGGVRIGQPYLEGQGNLPLGYNRNVKIHHNAIINNGTDEANAAPGSPVGTSGAGGGLAIEAGSDGFLVQKNWICGNFSAGDGGGVGILGNSSGSLVSNSIIFNESYQQTGPSFGGGLAIEGEPGTGTTPSTGVGNIVVDGNLIQGNAVRSGSGGGIRVASVNGTELTATRPNPFKVAITNNLIVNNVAGWAGAGISLVDSAYVTLWGNTIASNDAVGVAGNLMNTSVNGLSTGPVTAVPSPSGVASEPYSTALAAVLPKTGNNKPASLVIAQPTVMENNVIWHNRSFFFDASSGTARICASNDWTDAGSHNCTQLAAQTAVGQCDLDHARYWDVGVVGDSSVAPGANKLAFDYTVISSTSGYTGAGYTGNQSNDPLFLKGYCNGGRVQPGSQFEPGSPFQPPFQLAAAASLDESGNFVDFQFGPLSLNDPVTPANGANGNYHLSTASPAADAGFTPTAAIIALVQNNGHDIDGDSRPVGSGYDAGADEIGTAVTRSATLSNQSGAAAGWNFASHAVGTTTGTTFTFTNSGAGSIVVSGTQLSGTNANQYVVAQAGTSCIGGLLLPPAASCTVSVNFVPTSAGSKVASIAVNSATAGVVTTNDPASLNGTAFVPPRGRFNVASLSFSTPTGTTSAVQTLTFTNTTGSAITLANPPLLLAGANAASFAALPPGTGGCTAARTLNNNATCTISVSFTPGSSTTAQSATLSVSTANGVVTSDGVAALTASLSGIGTVPPATAAFSNPSGFNTTTANTTAKTGTVTISNSAAAGSANLGITTIAASATRTGGGTAGSFTVTAGTDNCSGTSLAPGASCTVGVRFVPFNTSGNSCRLSVAVTGALGSPVLDSFNCN